MVQKLTQDEKGFLKKKYMSEGYSKKEAEKKLELTMKLMVVSGLTVVI